MGNNKSDAELTAAVESGVGYVVVDSFEEIARLAFIAEKAAVRPRVLIRVTLGVEAHTHEFIATAHEDQKFGFSRLPPVTLPRRSVGSLLCRNGFNLPGSTAISGHRSSYRVGSRWQRLESSGCRANA